MNPSTTPADERSRALIDATIRVLTRAAEAGVVVSSLTVSQYGDASTVEADVFTRGRDTQSADNLAEAFDCDPAKVTNGTVHAEGNLDGIGVTVYDVTPPAALKVVTS